LLAKHPGEPLCLFYGLLAGFACAWLIDFSCTQGVDCIAQVTALRWRDSLRICHLFPMLHTGLPWFCTCFPQARTQRKPSPGIADIFLTANLLVLARAYEHAQEAFNLKTLFAVTGKDPAQVTAADVFDFLAHQRGDRTVIPLAYRALGCRLVPGPYASAMQMIEGAGVWTRPAAAASDWVEQLRAPDLSVGTYCIPAGALDTQSPHTEDEIYVVTAGRAKIVTPDGAAEVEPGSVIFVPAGEEHRFDEVTEDLALLVVFAPAYGTRKSS
jgi:mannose-6-phosphate isomerase-like protein (cupin superfamily)